MQGVDKRVFRVVAGVHGALLVALVLHGFLQGCLRRPPDRVIPVEFLVDVRPPVPDPAPTERPTPPPRPEPQPEPQPVPAPRPPRQIQVNTNRIVRQTAPPAAQPTPPAPNPLSPEEIRRLLAEGAQASDRTSIPDADGRGLAVIRQALDAVWQPPARAAVGDAEALLELRLEPDGTVRASTLSRPSGNSVLDESVTQAAARVGRIHGLPPGFAARRPRVTIAFTVE